ncbi:hypothetical protein Btru_023649 [Bulinus truncatus]|nr:hypothetical protein Btru_023649 [Bulinus truncatus]
MTNKLSVILPRFGVHVTYQGSKLSVQVPGRYNLVGLCGDCNSDKFELRNGTAISVSNRGEDLSDKEMIQVANDWRVEDPDINSEECKLPPPLPEDRCSEDEKAKVVSECQKVFQNPSNVFGITASKFDFKLDSYYENCRYDGCLQNLKEAICNLAKAMVQQFAANGHVLESWRDVAGCPMSCTGDTVYKANAACQRVCGVTFTSTAACQEIPDEDCVCADSDKWKQGNKCVPENQCGCQYYLANNTVGYFLKPDESILSPTCSDKIICNIDEDGVGSLIYSAYALPINAECITVNPSTPPKVDCARGFTKEPAGDNCIRNPKECKQGYQKIGDQCVYVDKANSWREAVQECNEKDGTLLKVVNDATEDLLKKLLEQNIDAYIAGRVLLSDATGGIKFNEVLKASEKGRIEYANYECEDHLRKKISLSPRLNPSSILNNGAKLAVVVRNDNGRLVYSAVASDTPASFVCIERNITDADTDWYPPCNNDDNMSDDGDQELRSDLILNPDCLVCPFPMDINCVPNPNPVQIGEVEGTCALNDGVYYSCNEGDICIDKGISLRCVKDIDECASGIHECPENSKCVNTIGAYSCVCNKDFPAKIDGKCYGVDTCEMSGPPTLSDYVYTVKGFTGVSGLFSYDCQYKLAYICDNTGYNPSSGLPYISFNDMSSRSAGNLVPYITGSIYNPVTDRYITWGVNQDTLCSGKIMIGRNNSEPVLTLLSFTDSETKIKFQYTDGCGIIIKDTNNHFTAKISWPLQFTVSK